MLATTTHSDSATLIWSPQHDKLAYVTCNGLQVYVMDQHTDEERHFVLSDEVFATLDWSPDGRYLTVQSTDGGWTIYSFKGTQAQTAYMTRATSLEWVDTHQLIYVPEPGGLVLVYLGGERQAQEVILAG